MILILVDDEADSQTEGEELERAREARRQEVKLKPVQYLPTDTETEVSTRCWSINLGVWWLMNYFSTCKFTSFKTEFLEQSLKHQR